MFEPVVVQEALEANMDGFFSGMSVSCLGQEFRLKTGKGFPPELEQDVPEGPSLP